MKQARPTYSERALVNLAKAGRGLDAADRRPPVRREFDLASARVLAILDVADAFRQSGPADEALRRFAKGAGPSGALTAYFGREGEHDTRVTVFHHIRKTAGSSLRQMLHVNLRGFEVQHDELPIKYPTREAHAAWYRAWYEGLGSRRDLLRCAASHSANYLLPILGDRAVGVTLVRDPVDHVLSACFSGTKAPDPADPRAALERIYGGSASSKGRLGPMSVFFNGQSVSLLQPHFDVTELEMKPGRPPGAATWQRRLLDLVDEQYVTGVQGRFEDSLGLFAAQLGWKTEYVANAKRTSCRPRATEIDDDLVETIRQHCWLDLRLHEHCVERMDRELATLR